MRPLSDNLQGYPAAEVAAVMAQGGQWTCRTELYDLSGNRIHPDVLDVGAADVAYDETKELKLSFTLRMLPDERLRYAFRRFIVVPVVGVGPMRDGGIAEFRLFGFLWTKPKRTGWPLEEWEIELADANLHLLQLAGPHETPFVVSENVPVWSYIVQVLQRAGVNDTTGVAELPWPVRTLQIYTYDAALRWKEGETWGTGTPAKGEAETWLNIAKDLHKAGACTEPFSAASGRYLAVPDKQWWAAPADAIYTTTPDSLVLPDHTIEPDMARIANYVKGWTTTGDQFFSGHADLNDFLPAHPLAEASCGGYVDAKLSPDVSNGASSDVVIDLQCILELFKRIADYDKLTVKTTGFAGVHEGFELIGANLIGDAELTAPVQVATGIPLLGEGTALFREAGWTLDCFNGNMTHDLRRLFRLLNEVGLQLPPFPPVN